jgi:glycosyltransferase involved in cell wall biosynthesis
MKLLGYWVLLFFCCATQATELPFVISICSFNNALWVKKNLDSIRKQLYSNYRIIYVDDASTDGTADLVEAYIKKYKLQDRVTLLRSTSRMRKLYHLYRTFHTCEDHEIIVQVDGDDTLADPHVLSLLNDIFLNNDVWLSYGSHRAKSGYKSGGRALTKEEITNALFRKPPKPLSIGHLKAFKAWLFKAIKLEDLLVKNIPGWQGQFYPVANDTATVCPMLEMGRHHLWYNRKIVYRYNDKNSWCSHKTEKKLQQACAKEIVNAQVYPELLQPLPCKRDNLEHARIACCIVPGDAAADTLLSLCKKYVHDVDAYIVVSEPEQIVALLDFDYVLCVQDSAVLRKPISCKAWVKELVRTGAYGCYGMPLVATFKKHGVTYQQIDQGLYAWQFACDKQTLVDPHNVCLSLYRKEDVLKIIDTAINERPTIVPDYRVGLFFLYCIPFLGDAMNYKFKMFVFLLFLA